MKIYIKNVNYIQKRVDDVIVIGVSWSNVYVIYTEKSDIEQYYETFMEILSLIEVEMWYRQCFGVSGRNCGKIMEKFEVE